MIFIGKVYDLGNTEKHDIKGYNHMTNEEHQVTRGEGRLFYNSELDIYYVDFNSDGLVLNSSSMEQIDSILEDAISQKLIQVGFAMHEQYFYSGYAGYQYNYAEKVEFAVKKMTDNGYEPIFYEEYLPENR